MGYGPRERALVNAASRIVTRSDDADLRDTSEAKSGGLAGVFRPRMGLFSAPG
jgi:hypothetical protein